MTARDTIRKNKTAIQVTLCGDYRLILDKIHESDLITLREYNNLKSINKETVEGHAVELVDKIMNKGERTCQAFLDLLQTDQAIKTTYPELRDLQLNNTRPLSRPVEASSDHSGGLSQESKRHKKEEVYQLTSQPVGLCVIINNENFMDGSDRCGTNKDAEALAKVFSWLGFRVLMFRDQTKDEMERALVCLASLSDLDQLRELAFKEWSDGTFTDSQQGFKHGDAFICCILSHGQKGEVLGTDRKPVSIKQITRAFKGTHQSALTGKPKVFLIQACQGGQVHRGVLVKDVEADDSGSGFIPEEADVLVAVATVEDYYAFRNTSHGSWFVQSLYQQLREGCPRGEDITAILHRVNDDVSQKEGGKRPGEVKQMPEVRFTLRKRLVLSPCHN